ncbi:MAG TPA: tRNA 2-thiouridine(34) synthase MnmA [Anaerolineaceae bacterium]|nr:tRNA 2-thiouridine(34) synthase MnmA [Anaerolineaceae bacterium]
MKVVVGMSGGVDSSVAAALLVQQGYSVIGMMLRLWNEPGKEAENRCCTPDAMAQARRVAAILGIPFYAIDAQERFRGEVVQYFLDAHREGITPNPCLVCNRKIRWGYLLQHAQTFGAEAFATGHYVRLRTDDDGRYQLMRALDERKDQSYVLSMLSQDQLSRSLFPLGEYTKPHIREIARELKLPVAERADSQDLCFIADRDYRRFLLDHAPDTVRPGPIRDRQGNDLGEHQGLAFYTIGQRKGLGLASSEPIYVLEKNIVENVLVVGPAEELGKDHLEAVEARWIAGEPPAERFRAEVKIRYKADAVPGWVTIQSNLQFSVDFDCPLRDITAGQAAVVYQGENCLGAGLIAN